MPNEKGKTVNGITLNDFIMKNKVGGSGLSLLQYMVLNRRIVASWAFLYMGHQGTFLWMGASAFASKQVGDQMLASYKDFQSLMDANLSAIIAPVPTILRAAADEIMIRQLGRTNAAVFNDLYWQHLAYASGGLPLLEKIYQNAGLDKTAPAALAAWKQIAEGEAKTNSALIFDGNLELLKYEQAAVVQKYSFSDELSRDVAAQMSKKGVASPIPNGTGFPVVAYQACRPF